MGRLAKKTIVIVGGTSGLGLSATRICLAEGACVLAVGWNSPPANRRGDQPSGGEQSAGQKSAGQKAVSPLSAGQRIVEMSRGSQTAGDPSGEDGPANDELESSIHRERLLVCNADARQPQTAERAIAMADERWGSVDGLYHVAGGSGRGFGDGALHDLTDEGWKQTLDWNLSSLFYSYRAATRYWLEKKRGGAILGLSSVLATRPAPRYFSTHAYAAAKGAIQALTVSASSYYAAANIRFNVLAPGLCDTPMARRAVGDATISEYVESRQPLEGGRVGLVTDLDGAVVYFLSDESRFVTGQVLAVDGGWSVVDLPPATPTEEVESK